VSQDRQLPSSSTHGSGWHGRCSGSTVPPLCCPREPPPMLPRLEISTVLFRTFAIRNPWPLARFRGAGLSWLPVQDLGATSFWSGRRPRLPFRGVLRPHTRYGPSIRSPAQGRVFRRASTPPNYPTDRLSTVGPTGRCPSGTCPHKVTASLGTPKSKELLRSCVVCGWSMHGRNAFRIEPIPSPLSDQ
jgi:hypothetical protein